MSGHIKLVLVITWSTESEVLCVILTFALLSLCIIVINLGGAFFKKIKHGNLQVKL